MTNDLTLRRPSPELLQSYFEGCRETFGHVHNPYILHDPAQFAVWKNTIFRQFADEEAGRGLPAGYVASATFWLVYDAAYAGTVNIRLELTPQLCEYGGSIGLALRTSLRGRHLATQACQLGIEQARALGVDPILITCVESNTPSLRALLRTDYRSGERAMANADGAFVAIRKFRY